MSDAELSARLLDAMAVAAAKDAQTALVSLTMEVLDQGDLAHVEAKVVRKTRTLVFMSADAQTSDGKKLAAASAVYKVLA